MRPIYLFLFSAFFVFNPSTLKAQSNFADFRVVVKDLHDSAIGGVKVELYKEGVLKVFEETDLDGRSGFPTLEPGIYTVVLKKDSFYYEEQKVLTIGYNQEMRVTYSTDKVRPKDKVTAKKKKSHKRKAKQKH